MLRACQRHTQAESAGVLARVRTPSLPVRERERERDKKKEREGERERDKKKESEGE